MAVVKELIRTEENGVSALVIMNYRQNLKHLISHIREMFIK